ncbi:shikimate 5-dehydrogenase [Marinomonas ushuaiensis DSM 15871]|uniref:Shikimate dehydrogenase (NADP(+)) n=2 Tax=Marinomonas TaxID=28253 RepID=X7E7Y9_9GAMM|nr:shikimate dehydrogenase [Marinomonas ushuaiensis]ETX12199.1 shikimate 5-dehydrogenase [Marinomonas ushuaiensis DSM 15871]
MDQYAVFGNPIAHSKSPDIHMHFAKETQQGINYMRILGDDVEFENQVRAFFEKDGKGLNVTSPFKDRAFAMCDVLSSRAKKAGAVNTLMMGKNGELFGDTTDGVGMVRDIVETHQQSLKGKRILIIGAGGAVQGILDNVLAENPSSVTIANRTVEKAQVLAEKFGCLASSFEALEGAFDLIINGTSASRSSSLPPLKDELANERTWCYDMTYGKGTTVFLQWAIDHGATGADGLGMLVGQAAESFYIWRQVRPDMASLLNAMRQQLEES